MRSIYTTRLFIHNLFHSLWAIEDNPVVPADSELEHFAILETPSVHERTLFWQSKSNADEGPSFRPWHLVKPSISTNPCSDRNSCDHENHQHRRPEEWGDELTGHVVYSISSKDMRPCWRKDQDIIHLPFRHARSLGRRYIRRIRGPLGAISVHTLTTIRKGRLGYSNFRAGRHLSPLD